MNDAAVQSGKTTQTLRAQKGLGKRVWISHQTEVSLVLVKKQLSATGALASAFNRTQSIGLQSQNRYTQVKALLCACEVVVRHPTKVARTHLLMRMMPKLLVET